VPKAPPGRTRAWLRGLRYASCWEDAAVVAEALKPLPGARCLSVASGGDNTLSILARRPASVMAIDVNPVQLALVELKAAAFAELAHPDLVDFLGAGVDAGRVPGLLRRPGDSRAWWRWSAFVGARPFAVIVLSAAPVLLLALPAARLKTDLPGGDWLPRGVESTDALNALRALGRVGVVQEVRVLLELPEDVQALDRRGWEATRRLAGALARDPRVERARTLADFAGERAEDLAYVSFLPGFLKQCFLGSEGDVVLVGLVPREEATAAELEALVRDLRGADAAAMTGLPGARLRVGGLPAFNADYEDAVSGRLPLGDLLLVRMLGFALAVAVLLDATLVRLALGPAVLRVAGRWNWWPGETVDGREGPPPRGMETRNGRAVPGVRVLGGASWLSGQDKEHPPDPRDLPTA